MKKDQFFGTGILVVEKAGDMVDKLLKNSLPAKSVIKNNKKQAIDNLLTQGKKDEVISILRNNSRFEMKFDSLRPSTEVYFERMVDIFLSDSNNRFSAMVINKSRPNFDGNNIQDAWETYTKYAAHLVYKEMKNMPSYNFCIIVDEITKPRIKALSLEDTLLSKIRDEVIKDSSVNFSNVFGALSIESHSNLLMQLCDVLLGAVMYDFKKKSGITSDRTDKRKELLVSKIRQVLNVNSLAQDFTQTSSAYFNVFESI